MITIFNRRELAVTFSMEQQANIRDILAGNHIDYALRTKNTAGGNGSRTGSLGFNMDYAYEYYFYVHRNDFEKAKYLIVNVNR